MRNGGDPASAAAWIERLPFATAEDRADVARKLHQQWRASPPAEADAWLAPQTKP